MHGATAADDADADGDADGEAAGGKRKRRGDAKGGRGKGRRANGGRRRSEEFGVSRGIDFKGVGTVVNLEMPASVEG